MRTVTARLVGLAALAGALAACGSGAAVPADSGVRGRVWIGPMCPVVQEGVPCPDRPFAARIRVLRDGKVVATTRSGADGRFRVALAPGRYVLDPVDPDRGAPPTSSPLPVRVAAHRFTQVRLVFDSGIR